MHILKDNNLKEHFIKLDSLISTIEVKGDSVQAVYNSRMIIKELFSLIEEIKEEEKPKEQDNNVSVVV